MEVAWDRGRLTGRAVDLSGTTFAPEAVVDAVRGGEGPPAVAAAAPGLVHDYVGLVRPGMSLSVRGALAAAARSLGHAAPQDDRREAVLAELSAIEVERVDTGALKRDVAAAVERERELDERVAALRGRVQAVRDRGSDAASAADELADAVRELSEVRTERIAAEQALASARRARRSARDRRSRRLALEDEAANLARAARRHLAAEVFEAFASAVRSVPGRATVGAAPGSYEGDPVTAALAVARVAEVRAPVVLACSRFETPTAAAEALDAPVIGL